MIYLDHNATTPVAEEVLAAMLPYFREHFGNPGSSHAFGLAARAGVDAARAQVAALIGARPEEVVFTGGGTEASNLAIFGSSPASLVTSVLDHPATLAPCRRLAERGVPLTVLPVDAHGVVDLVAARAAVGPGLVTVHHANNEIGTLQPIAALAALAHAAGALMHTDAAQSCGKVPIDVGALGVDLLTIAGHKLYAPKGVGALFVRTGVRLAPQALGAGHEHGLRAGTENVASIVGLGAACALAARTLVAESARVRALRDELEARLRAGVPGLVVNGHPSERLPNTLSVCFPGVLGRLLLERTPLIAASTGSACHAGSETASAMLLALGLAPEVALGAVRLTLGRLNSAADVAAAAGALLSGWSTLR